VGPGATDADRDKAAAEAAKVAALIEKASAAQLALFRHLAETSPDGRYVVPASEWVDTMMRATEGLSEDDIKYLQSLNWTPAKITPEELRKKILEVLKDKKPAATGESGTGGADDKDKDKSKAQGVQGEAGGAGTAGTRGSQTGDAGSGDKGTRAAPQLSGFVQGRKYTGTLTTFDNAGFQIQPDKQITLNTKKGAKVTLEVRWLEGVALKRAKVEYEILADPVTDTDPNTHKTLWRFDMKSTNTDPLVLSPEGAEKPTVLPARASASYYMVKK
jgi:hypothetical protein